LHTFRAIALHFTQLPVEVLQDEASKVAIDAMLKGVSFTPDADNTHALTTDLDNLLAAMLKLEEYLTVSVIFNGDESDVDDQRNRLPPPLTPVFVIMCFTSLSSKF
jgi:hypothetical protein